MSLARWIEAHRRSVLVAAAAIALAGVASIPALPVGLFPRTTFPRVVVSVESGDRPADRMILEVTRPIEEALRGVPGVRNVRSTTSRGACDVSVDFAWGTPMVEATLQVESSLEHIVPSLPPGASFEVRRMDPFVFPVIGLSLTSSSGRSLVELRDLALYELAPRLSGVEGVARVAVQGGRSEEFQVLVDPARLEALGFALEDVVRAVSASNVVQAVGRLEQDEKLYLLLADNQIESAAELGAVVLRRGEHGLVELEDVAEIRVATVPEWMRVTAAGEEAVLINVYQQPDGNTVQIAAEVQRRLAERALPGDLRLATWYDQSELILASVGSLRDAIGIGAGLAIVVLAIFLRSARITLIAACVTPAVLASSVLLLRALGATFNLMTVGGLAAAAGLVIDDVIVVLEQIVRRLREAGGASRTVVFEAAGDILRPLAGSSAVSCVIFVPLAFLSGVTGAFLRPLSLTVAVSLIVSFGFALLVVPILAAWGVRERDAATRDVAPWLRALIDRYEGALGGLMARPLRALAAMAVVLALGAVAFERLGSGFLPRIDEGGFVLDYRAPAGTSLAETDRRLHEVERILMETPEVATYSRRTGLALGSFLTEANEGDFFVRLHAPPRRPIDEVIDDVRTRVEREVPGLEVELPQLLEDLIGDLTAVPQPIEIKLFGPDPARLRALADVVAAKIDGIDGVVDVKSGVVLAGDAIRIGVDRARAAALGLDPDQIARMAHVALEGEVVTQVQRPEKGVGVRVWTAPEARRDTEQIGRLQLRAADGSSVALGRVVHLERDTGQPQITRENLKTLVAVTGRISKRDLGAAMRDVQKVVAGVELPPGTYVEYGGLYREQQASFRTLATVIVAATLLVGLVLLYLYESALVLLAVAAVVSTAGAGGLVGLWISGSELNISSLMGLTMVVGISAEAAVFLLSHWHEASTRLALEPALREAGSSRLRPIVMTGSAAILALLPLAFGIGEGSAMLQPLAIAIVAGLAATVPAVLLLMPPLLFALARRRGRGGELRREA